jgi:hypothetical protein
MLIHKIIIKLRNKKLQGKSRINVLQTFPIFTAHGFGYYPARAKLTIQCINQIISSLSSTIKLNSNGNKNLYIFKKQIVKYFKITPSALELKKLFTKYGSDKATIHNYYLLYSKLLKKRSIQKIFEIGIGTNNPEIVSTMGINGKPGASLRAFRDYFINTKVFGADIDRNILFKEDRIKTFYLNQVCTDSFKKIRNKIPSDFDLMIDDGLHSPNANLNSLNFFMTKLRIGGYGVIEDINPLTKELYSIISEIIKNYFLSAFIKTKSAYIFIIKRIK